MRLPNLCTVSLVQILRKKRVCISKCKGMYALGPCGTLLLVLRKKLSYINYRQHKVLKCLNQCFEQLQF